MAFLAAALVESDGEAQGGGWVGARGDLGSVLVATIFTMPMRASCLERALKSRKIRCRMAETMNELKTHEWMMELLHLLAFPRWRHNP
jgi:hypothetical protein